MDKIHEEQEFCIYKFKHAYIVHNTKGVYSQNHTHIESFNTAKGIIGVVKKKRIPRSYSVYLLNSLKRLSLDEKYRDKVQELIDVKESKTKQPFVKPVRGYA